MLLYVLYKGFMTKLNKHPKDFTDLINQWPNLSDFATDLGCKYQTARKMKERNSIASIHWKKLIEASKKQGISGISYEWLVGVKSQELAE